MAAVPDVHISMVGFFVCCEIPSPKKAADRSSERVRILNFPNRLNAKRSGATLDPGEVTTWSILCLSAMTAISEKVCKELDDMCSWKLWLVIWTLTGY